jgi:UrcA family protein
MGIRRKPEGAQMPRPTASPDLSTSHYTRVAGTGDTASKASWVAPDAAPNNPPKETTMFRTLMTAAALALTVTAAQAGDTVTVHVNDLDLTRAQDAQILATRVHAAAKAACTPEYATHTPSMSHDNAVFQSCVNQASKSAMTKYQTMAKGTAAAHTQIAGQ